MKFSRMKKFMAIGFVVVALAAIGSATAVFAGQTGNGAPSGAHDTLNIIGVDNPKTADMDGSNGRVIFVHLNKMSKILLVEGEDFAVLDANGTDGNGAKFQLPPPDLDPYVIGDTDGADVVSSYSVFVRPLGKPGGWATITTCADVIDSSIGGLLSGSEIKVLNAAAELGGVCSIEQVGSDITMRTKGKSTFTNVTKELTTIVLQIEIDGEDPILVRVPIFDDSIENEYWEYNNHGLRLLQVRFYPCSTNVETGATNCFD